MKVSLKPFQRLVGAAANGCRPSQRAKYPLSFKAPRGVNAKPLAWQRGTHKRGFPFRYEDYINPLSAFFFDARGAKKKAWQKRTRPKRISPLRRRPTLRALDWRSLFEKSDVKTFKQTPPRVRQIKNLNLSTVFNNRTCYLKYSRAEARSSSICSLKASTVSNFFSGRRYLQNDTVSRLP